MKDFYTQCLKDLYALTGIEQVRWMLNDLKDGERNFDLCVSGMVQTSKQFPYISEDEQKKIIQRMMVEDQQYTALNSRTVSKWLSQFKDVYWTDQTHFVESPKITYGEYLNRCLKDGLEPLSESEWDKPVSDEKMNEFRAKLAEMFEAKEAEPKEGISDPLVQIMLNNLSSNMSDADRIARGNYVRSNYNEDGTKRECWSTFEEWNELTSKAEPLTGVDGQRDV